MKTFTLNVLPKKLPKIVCNENGITITGRSIPENPIDIFSPLIDWIRDNYAESEKKVLIDLEYFNTITLVYLITILQHVYKIDPNSEVLWYHDDEDVADMLMQNLNVKKIQFITKNYG
ncbi:MAG: DUF1987 domain-containing protein [Bacteroidales bacterium]|jgi:hypothetical protein|nr:DUF1987 domain-containing protein [Bacteroidales bacterium]